MPRRSPCLQLRSPTDGLPKEEPDVGADRRNRDQHGEWEEHKKGDEYVAVRPAAAAAIKAYKCRNCTHIPKISTGNSRWRNGEYRRKSRWAVLSPEMSRSLIRTFKARIARAEERNEQLRYPMPVLARQWIAAVP